MWTSRGPCSRAFVDLLGIGDSVGIASFGTTATADFPAAGPTAAPITDQTVKDAAVAQVDALTFDGLTFMGGGVAAAGGLLTNAPAPRSILLVSDGFDNRGGQPTGSAPTALQAVQALPTDVRLFSCAMGPTSDQALLESLASERNGRYYFMPHIDDLFEIYNYIRGQVTGDSIAVNASGQASHSVMPALVDPTAELATFVVTWADTGLHAVLGARPRRTRSRFDCAIPRPPAAGDRVVRALACRPWLRDRAGRRARARAMAHRGRHTGSDARPLHRGAVSAIAAAAGAGPAAAVRAEPAPRDPRGGTERAPSAGGCTGARDDHSSRAWDCAGSSRRIGASSRASTHGPLATSIRCLTILRACWLAERARPRSVRARQPADAFAGSCRARLDGRQRRSFKELGRDDRVAVGQFNDTAESGSYNVVVSARGVLPGTAHRFSRVDMVSVLVK